MRRCAFCDNEAVERGGEHVWDDWINREFRSTKGTFKFSSVSGISREYTKRVIDEKIPVVCQQCNSGWMSQITNRIKQTFRYAITIGAPMCILPSGIALLASFTLMKAIVGAQFIAENDEPFFTRADRERLRKTLAIPSSGVRMWIGAFKGKARHSTKFVPGVLTSDAPELAGIEYFTFTYGFGYLLVQLLAARWKDIRQRGNGYLPMLDPDPRWNPATARFWPFDGSPVTWPLPKHFNDSGVQQFINRFKLPMRVPSGE